MPITFKLRRELDVIVNGDTTDRGTISEHPDYGSLWHPGRYSSYTVEELRAIIEAMEKFAEEVES